MSGRGGVRLEAVDLDTGERLVFVSVERLASVSKANYVVVEAGSVTIADVVVTLWRLHDDCGGTGPAAAGRGRVRVGRWRVPLHGNEWLVEKGQHILYRGKGDSGDEDDE